MAKAENQKKKLLYIREYFLRETDEEHGVTVKQIIAYLKSEEIEAERKSIYDDIRCLQDYGMDIISEKIGRETYYKLVSRDFELPELKLLVDSVQSSKFITAKKTRELIKKLEQLVSRHQGGELQRQVHVVNRVKNPNEKIYLMVDKLHEAIHRQVQVEFQYAGWNLKKELVPRHDGKTYRVSPWALTWDDENYYLICYDEVEEKIKHFRVDKLLKLNLTEDERHGKELFSKFDLADYSKKTFGMFGGEEQSVKLKVKNSMVGVMIDRFGSDIMVIPDKDGEHFTVNVDVVISDQFIGWLTGLGTAVEVVSPQEVRDCIKDSLKKIVDMY